MSAKDEGVHRTPLTGDVRLNAANESSLAIDLSPLREGRMAPPALPLSLFGPWSTWIAKAASAANAPEDYVTAALLSAASGAIGNARWACAWNGWTEPPVLWIGLVGDPSAGKSPAIDLTHSALRQLEAEEAKNPERWLSQPPRTAGQLAGPRLVVGDTTQEALAAVLSVNPRGVLIVRDELTGWLTGMNRYSGASDRSFYIEAYGGRAYTVDRKGGGTFSIPRLCVPLIGGVQPDRFASLITRCDDDGLAARFLYVCPDRRAFKRPTEGADGDRILHALRKLRTLQMEQGEPVNVGCSEGAQAVLEKFCSEPSNEAASGSTLFRSWCGKGRGHVLRVSLILEHLDWAYKVQNPEPKSISEEAMVRSIALYAEYFVPMAKRVFGDAMLPPAERDAGALARWIVEHRPGKLTVREVYRARIGGIATPDRARQALGVLVDAGWISEAPTRAGNTLGRMKDAYDVNVGLWQALEGGTNG